MWQGGGVEMTGFIFAIVFKLKIKKFGPVMWLSGRALPHMQKI